MDTTSAISVPTAPSAEAMASVVNSIASAVVIAFEQAMRRAIREELASTTVANARGAESASEWMTADECALALRCKRQRIYKLKVEGRIPDEFISKDGSRLLIHRNWLNLRLQGGAA